MQSNFQTEDFHLRSYDESLNELMKESQTNICLFIDHGATVVSDIVNILLIYESESKDSRIAFQMLLKLLKSPSVQLTVLHKTMAVADVDIPLLENPIKFVQNQSKKSELSGFLHDTNASKNVQTIELLETMMQEIPTKSTGDSSFIEKLKKQLQKL